MGTKHMIAFYSTALSAIVASSVLVPQVAHAGKPERDKADELHSTVTATTDDVHARCGCVVKVEVKWDSYATSDDMARIGDALNSIQDAAKGFCEKDADKAAFCKNVEGFQLGYGKEGGEAALPSKTISVTSSDSGFTSVEQIRALMDKF